MSWVWAALWPLPTEAHIPAPTAHSHSHGRVDDTLWSPVHSQDDGAIVVHVHQCHQRHQEDGEACGQQSVEFRLPSSEPLLCPALWQDVPSALCSQSPPSTILQAWTLPFPTPVWISHGGGLSPLTSPPPPHHPGALRREACSSPGFHKDRREEQTGHWWMEDSSRAGVQSSIPRGSLYWTLTLSVRWRLRAPWVRGVAHHQTPGS